MNAIQYWIDYIKICRPDYTETECTGFTTSFSELLMHTRQTEKKIAHLFLNPTKTYAYAITEEGILIDGCYHLSDNKDNPAMTTQYTLKHGTLEITGSTNSRTQRVDKYTSNSGDVHWETCQVTDATDDSGRVSNYDRESPFYRQYNPACSCCYFNFSHSVNKHDQEVTK